MHKIFSLIAILVFLPVMAFSHELRPAVADIQFSKGTVRIDMDVTLEALVAGIDPSVGDTSESENAARYDALRNMSPLDLKAQFKVYQPVFQEGLHLSVDGVPLKVANIGVEIPPVGDTDLVRDSNVILTADIPVGATEMTFGWAREFGPVIVRVTTMAGEDGYSVYLKNGNDSEAFSVEGVTPQSAISVFANYIIIGFQHILPKGIDHILFVVGLYLLSTRIRPLLWQVSAFTVAHTISLALGMLGLVAVPSAIVEPLIAASIVYVGVENILVKGLSPWRPFVVFLFGLLHGLGFASVLAEVGMPKSQFIEGLIGFNIGVELGQLTVIAICFAFFGYWFGRKPWYRKVISNPMSMGISLIASYWFIERTFL